jgi:hypothetical protein
MAARCTGVDKAASTSMTDDAEDDDVAPRDDASNDNADGDADDNAKRGAKPRAAEG